MTLYRHTQCELSVTSLRAECVREVCKFTYHNMTHYEEECSSETAACSNKSFDDLYLRQIATMLKLIEEVYPSRAEP